MAARDLGMRVACLRTGIVLGPGGGALAAMLPPFRAGLGGPFGGGRQFFPWITRDDLVALYALALDRDDLVGPVNAVTPDYATNARFAQALGNALGRPALVVVPAFALRPLLGEFGQTLLESQLMLPAVAEDAGFVWKFPHLEDALLSVLGSKRRTNVRHFESEQLVKADLETVFEFFSNPGNLEAITPPTLGFNIERRPVQMQRGAQIAYTLRIRGIGVKWTTLIARWEPRRAFVDVQLHGPYALWRHRHTFEPASGGVRIRDAVDYILPFAPFGNVAASSVRRDIDSIFAYRTKVIESRFG
jgi:ligand-binding SRPBCC domain-containing protein